MSDFLLGLASGLILLLVTLRVTDARETRDRKEKQRAALALEEEVRKSLDGFGMGVTTLGLCVVLNNRTGVSLKVRRVEIGSEDGSQVVRLQHNPDSHDHISKELPKNGQRTSVEKKCPSPVGLSQEFGEVTAHSRADWVLPCSLRDLVRFSPSKVTFVVEFNYGANPACVIEHEAKGSMNGSIPYYVDAWRQKCQEWVR